MNRQGLGSLVGLGPVEKSNPEDIPKLLSVPRLVSWYRDLVDPPAVLVGNSGPVKLFVFVGPG